MLLFVILTTAFAAGAGLLLAGVIEPGAALGEQQSVSQPVSGTPAETELSEKTSESRELTEYCEVSVRETRRNPPRKRLEFPLGGLRCLK